MLRIPTTLLLAACILLIGHCHRTRNATGDAARLHLVIDAGSSGTRFCGFRIELDATQACKAFPIKRSKCIRVKADGGLADLSATETARVIKTGLENFQGRFGQPTAIALLGTGGFRRLAPEDQKKAVMKVRSAVDAHSKTAAVAVLSGEQEGILAWHSMRLAHEAHDFATLETGGATLQYALRSAGQIHAKSFALGLDETYRALASKPGFAACKPSASKSKDDFARCRDLIRSRLALIGNHLPKAQQRPEHLYGLGSTWDALFALAASRRLDHTDLERLGTRFCSLTREGTIAAGVPAAFAGRTCFLISFQTELLRQTAHVEILRGGESWPRGAAVDETFFPICAQQQKQGDRSVRNK